MLSFYCWTIYGFWSQICDLTTTSEQIYLCIHSFLSFSAMRGGAFLLIRSKFLNTLRRGGWRTILGVLYR